MNAIMIEGSHLPYGFCYPQAFCKLIDLCLLDFDLWFVMNSGLALATYRGLEERYPSRRLIPFAKRGDNDDVACFEMGKAERIQIIHNFSSEGREQRGEFLDIWDWLRHAVEEMIIFNRE